MGNALTQGVDRIVIEDECLLRDYKNASVSDYIVAKGNFDQLQETVGDKMTVTDEEFDEIFSLICQDPLEHFKLFDCWDLGKARLKLVDVMEVLAVIIVYLKCSMDEKIPLLFDLFDFDHSREISESELVLLMLCTTRGLCKVVGLDRPDTAELEALAHRAFASIDRDHSGQISLAEFTLWATHEPSLMVYLKRFASARLIFDNQLQYDELLRRLCDAFLHAASPVVDQRGRKQLALPATAAKELLHKLIPATTEAESQYLVETMHKASGSRRSSSSTTTSLDSETLVSMDVFCLVVAPYVAFVVADEDQQHAVDRKELKILLWLMRGKEPGAWLVTSTMASLDVDRDGVLSALEWVSYALESDAKTGDSLAFSTQVQLLFACADRNGDAVLSIQELIAGLKPILLESVMKLVDLLQDGEAKTAMEAELRRLDSEPATVVPVAESGGGGGARRRLSQVEVVHSLITGLANELMQTLDKNQSHRIEWFEFRQHLDYLQQRIQQTKEYITAFVLGGGAQAQVAADPPDKIQKEGV